MWYLAEILFAEPRTAGSQPYQCEACNVVFEAATAVDAYQKAVVWGKIYAAEPPAATKLLGIAYLTIVDEQLGDGTEICGRFFQSHDVWDNVELVPLPNALTAIVWEQSQNVSIGELLGPEKIETLERIWGSKGRPEFAAHISFRLSAQRALLTHVTPSLRAVSIAVDEANLKWAIRFIFDGKPSEAHLELARGAVTELISDFPDWEVADEFLKISAPEKITHLDWVVFQRAEDG